MLDKLILKDSLEFNGTISDLKELMRFKKDREFRLEWIDDSTFKFLSNFSLGTLFVNYLPVEGIKGFAKLSELENGKTKVDLTTKIRIELYFFIIIFGIILISALITKEPFPIWIYGLLPMGLIWLWWVYRIQEKALFKRLKKYINLDLENAL